MQTEVSIKIRQLMTRFRNGDPSAAGALMDHLYPELRRIAAYRMGAERQDHTWTPTALVNELYLELIKIRALRTPSEDADEREQFLRLAAFLMRRLLIHHARPLYRQAKKVDLSEMDTLLEPGELGGVESLTQVSHLLDRLAKVDPKLRLVVELRVFEGQTAEEAARTIGCSIRTVHDCWRFARHWLASEIGTETTVSRP